jgi:hypothetical protein
MDAKKYLHTETEEAQWAIFQEGSEQFSAPYPIWIRVPAPGRRCYWTGLSKNALNELILPRRSNGGHPPVKSILLTLSGKRGRGVRLVSLKSLLSFLKGMIGESEFSTNKTQQKQNDS